MASFFSALGGTYAKGKLQQKQASEAETQNQQQAYINILSKAAEAHYDQWSPEERAAYWKAIGDVGDVKSQKGAKKSGLAGLGQKLTGGPKGGSNLGEMIQKFFGSDHGGGEGSPMVQTSGAGQVASEGSSGGATPTHGVSGQFNPPFTSQVPGAPEGSRLPSGGPPVPPMPESFQRRQGVGKTVRGGGVPTRLGGGISLGGPTKDIGKPAGGVMVGPDGKHYITYVNDKGEKTRIDLGEGKTEQEYLIEKRAQEEVKKYNARKQGDLDTVIAIGIKNGDYADYESGMAVEGPKYRAYMEAKWGAADEKHRAALATEADRAGRLAMRDKEYNLNYQNYLLRAHGQQRADAELNYKQTQSAIQGFDRQITDLEHQRNELQLKRDKLYTTPPNARLNPKDTQEAHDAQIDQYNTWMSEATEKIKVLQQQREALVNADPWMNTQDLSVPRGRRTPPPARPSSRPSTGGGKKGDPLGILP